jgi:type II secretory pathway component PulJ
MRFVVAGIHAIIKLMIKQEVSMKSAVKQIRKIQTEIDRQEACRRQIAKLERELQEAGEAARTGTDELILGLAQQRGIFSLAPTQILAVFDSLRVPISGELDSRPPVSADAAVFDETGELTVVVRFGNHKGSKKELLREAGLTRNGKLGEWHGLVSRVTLMRLRETFQGKVTVLAIHPQSTLTDASAEATVNDAQAVKALDHSAGATSGAPQIPAASDIDAAPSMPGSINKNAAVGGASEAGDGVTAVSDRNRPASARNPFSALPRRPERKREGNQP